MFRGSLRKGKSVRGFLEAGLLDSRKLARRHDQLAQEMLRRGYRHASPLPRDFDAIVARGQVDETASMRELAARCEECRLIQASLTAPSRARAPRRSRDVERTSR